MEETTNPCGQNPEDDENQQRRPDHVHDSLEMTLILGTLDERRGLANEGTSSRFSDDRVGLATLATGSIIADVTHILVDSQGLSSDGRLIAGDDGIPDVMVLVVIRVSVVLGVMFLGVFDEFLELFKSSWVVKVADQFGLAGNDGAFFEDELQNTELAQDDGKCMAGCEY